MTSRVSYCGEEPWLTVSSNIAPSIAVANQERDSQINPERLKRARTVAAPHYRARLNMTSSLVSGKTPSFVNFNSRSVSDVMVRFSVGSPT